MSNAWRQNARYHFVGARQIKPYSRAAADPALDLRRATGLASEAIHHGKAEPIALAQCLGGKERLEGAARCVGPHPKPRDDDFDNHVIAWRDRAALGIARLDNHFSCLD